MAITVDIKNLTVDLYKQLEIDRSWDEKAIRERLKGIQKLWIQRQSSTNDKEQLLLIEDMLTLVEAAFKYLTKATKRQDYDKALDAAYKSGLIKDEAEEKLVTLLEQASAYYRKGNIQMATKLAQEVVDSNINDPAAYNLLARCHFDSQAYGKALDVVDKGLSIFSDNIDLHWLGSRIATEGTKDFNDAQQRVNKLIELTPDMSIGHAEQIYLHARSGNESAAFEEIDTYLTEHPSDKEFKQQTAYNLANISKGLYAFDEQDKVYYIPDKESYDRFLALREKALNLYQDEFTQEEYDTAVRFGQRSWNIWNTDSVKALGLYGGILAFLYWPVGIILLLLCIVLICFSFRPNWQISKAYYTGSMGTAIDIINTVGEKSAVFAKWFFKFILKVYKWLIKAVFWFIQLLSRS